MADLGTDQIEFKVHGLTPADHGLVPARVFADKLKQLVNALEASDEIQNGKKCHEYVLSNLHMSDPTALIRERKIESFDVKSAIPVFEDAIEGIKTNDNRRASLEKVVRKIELLTRGAEKTFGFAEIRTTGNVVRIDQFLDGRRKSFLPMQVAVATVGAWFKGVVYGSFDGKLQYIDARGALPQIKLVLTAGGKEIDCVCRREDIETLGGQLTHRVRIYGRAFHDGKTALPVRVEVSSIEVVDPNSNFERWKGAFLPFEPKPWDESE